MFVQYEIYIRRLKNTYRLVFILVASLHLPRPPLLIVHSSHVKNDLLVISRTGRKVHYCLFGDVNGETV